MPLPALLTQLQQWQQQASQLHIRLPIVWQGEQDTMLDVSRQLLGLINYKTLYWIGEQAPTDATNLTGKHNYQLLGSECDVLVINAFNGFPADLIAASAGCVKAGGIWLLLCPPFSSWIMQPNTAHKSLLPYPINANNHVGKFLPFWLQQLQLQNVLILHNENLIQQLDWPALPALKNVPPPCITDEQQHAVAAIMKVVTGHRRRPLVLTADRGRGKSAALGIAAAQLAGENKHILITAPSPQAAQTALKHFQMLATADQQHQLQFVPYDELLRSVFKTDLLLIDEAAAIPAPVLQQLLGRFSRIVFATTEHGYEGTGRGFQLRFQQYLSEQCPGWHKLHMHQAIRYQAADPLEQLIFNGFLLNQTCDQPSYAPNMAIKFIYYSAKDWLTHPIQLQQVFGLLSLAHYQTQVKDLAALLDNPQLTVITLQQDNQLLACGLISREGNLPTELCTQIYHAQRRVQGHLLAQSLAFHLAQPQLATTALWRVMRIAVQPALQRQKLGAMLLEQLYQTAKIAEIDYLGTSFGATANLVKFWQHSSYLPVRLGSTFDKASAEYSILMLRSVSASPDIPLNLQQRFGHQLYRALAHYPSLSSKLALMLAQPEKQNPLTHNELEQLSLFREGKRPFELIRPLLLQWFDQQKYQPDSQLHQILSALLWQQLDWSVVLQCYSFVSKKECINHIVTLLRKYDC